MEALKRCRNVSGNILPVALNVADNTLKSRGIFSDVLDNNKKKKKERREKKRKHVAYTLSLEVRLRSTENCSCVSLHYNRSTKKEILRL